MRTAVRGRSLGKASLGLFTFGFSLRVCRRQEGQIWQRWPNASIGRGREEFGLLVAGFMNPTVITPIQSMPVRPNPFLVKIPHQSPRCGGPEKGRFAFHLVHWALQGISLRLLLLELICSFTV